MMGLEWPLAADYGTKIGLKASFQGNIGMKNLGIWSTKLPACNQTKYLWVETET